MAGLEPTTQPFGWTTSINSNQLSYITIFTGTPPRTWTLTNSFGDYRATNYTRGVWSRVSYFIYTLTTPLISVNIIICSVSLNTLSQYCLFLLCYNRHCKWLEFKNDLCIFLKNRSNWTLWVVRIFCIVCYSTHWMQVFANSTTKRCLWFIENGECTFSHSPLIHINQMENWCSFTIYHNMAPSTIVGFSGTNVCLPTIPTSLSRYRYSSYETRLLLTFEVRTLCGLIMPCQAMAGVAGFEPANAGVKVRCLTAWLHPNI